MDEHNYYKLALQAMILVQKYKELDELLDEFALKTVLAPENHMRQQAEELREFIMRQCSLIENTVTGA